jgi:hypothetical protein
MTLLRFSGIAKRVSLEHEALKRMIAVRAPSCN